MPQLLESQHVGIEQIDLVGCPGNLPVVLFLRPALGILVHWQTRLVQIEQVKGCDAEFLHRDFLFL